MLALTIVARDEPPRIFARLPGSPSAATTIGMLLSRARAIAAARGTGLPVVACMVFDSGKDKDRTMMGTTPEEAAVA